MADFSSHFSYAPWSSYPHDRIFEQLDSTPYNHQQIAVIELDTLVSIGMTSALWGEFFENTYVYEAFMRQSSSGFDSIHVDHNFGLEMMLEIEDTGDRLTPSYRNQWRAGFFPFVSYPTDADDDDVTIGYSPICKIRQGGSEVEWAAAILNAGDDVGEYTHDAPNAATGKLTLWFRAVLPGPAGPEDYDLRFAWSRTYIDGTEPPFTHVEPAQATLTIHEFWLPGGAGGDEPAEPDWPYGPRPDSKIGHGDRGVIPI